jgi:hypothetical protein
MTELVFLCPNCSAISRGGTIDKQAVDNERHSTWPVTCERRCQESRVPLEQMMLHDTATGLVLRFPVENSE